MKDVCLSEPLLWLKWFHQLSSMSQAWTRLLLCRGLIHRDRSNTILNFVWHFPYSAPCPVAQASAKHRPGNMLIQVEFLWMFKKISLLSPREHNVSQLPWVPPAASGEAGALERGVIRPHSNLWNGFILEKISFFFVYVCMECLWLTLHRRCPSAKSIHGNNRRMGQLAGFLQGHVLLSK